MMSGRGLRQDSHLKYQLDQHIFAVSMAVLQLPVVKHLRGNMKMITVANEASVSISISIGDHIKNWKHVVRFHGTS